MLVSPLLLLLLAPVVASGGNQSDTDGCLVREADETNVWVIHSDDTRNWLGRAACIGRAATWPGPAIDAVPKALWWAGQVCDQ